MLVLLLVSCKKSALENKDETLPQGTTIVSGTFTGSSHPARGTAKVTRDAAGKTFLVFENFNTDNGPDLRVWLSSSNNATTYQEVGVLKAVSGNFSYELNASVNYTVNNRVLIWCEDFSVLFGYAILQ